MRRATIMAMALTAVPLATAVAQQSLATGSTIHGNNTIQQAPSGGAVQAGRAVTTGSTRGEMSEEDKRIERENKAATQICKGC